MWRVRHNGLLRLLPLLALASSCALDIAPEPSAGDWDLDWSGCHSDDECPANEICTGLISPQCSWADVCSSDADCAQEEQCRYRMALGSPGASRKTCTPPADDGCNPGGSETDAAAEEDATWSDREEADGPADNVSDDASTETGQ